jgi:hypothetical protein
VELKYLNAQNGSSSWKTIKNGVPQGSVLGPLLFSIYINDFSIPTNKISDVTIFADDTSILISNNNCTDLNQMCTSVLSHITKWFQANQLVLNVEKTNMVQFTLTKFSHSLLQLTYEGKILTEADHIKFLGLLIWKTHID